LAGRSRPLLSGVPIRWSTSIGRADNENYLLDEVNDASTSQAA
jgi:hypothetical protein